jgi:hypothetical protein
MPHKCTKYWTNQELLLTWKRSAYAKGSAMQISKIVIPLLPRVLTRSSRAQSAKYLSQCMMHRIHHKPPHPSLTSCNGDPEPYVRPISALALFPHRCGAKTSKNSRQPRSPSHHTVALDATTGICRNSCLTRQNHMPNLHTTSVYLPEFPNKHQ